MIRKICAAAWLCIEVLPKVLYYILLAALSCVFFILLLPLLIAVLLVQMFYELKEISEKKRSIAAPIKAGICIAASCIILIAFAATSLWNWQHIHLVLATTLVGGGIYLLVRPVLMLIVAGLHELGETFGCFIEGALDNTFGLSH